MKHHSDATAPVLDLVEPWQKYGFALYVHWPFCESKCPYCDFNSHVAAKVDHEKWRAAFISEIRRVGAETKGRQLRSIFFGGGTPSLMEASTVAAIIDESARCWTFANDIEITLEANPSSVEAAKFREFRSAGINRVSIGVQALNDADLRRLGRRHSAAEGTSSVRIAQSIFARTSFDLIYARQDQTLDAWERELTMALSFASDHLSLYQLTIEPDTVFGARTRAGKLRGLPTEDRAADMYTSTQEICAAAGMPAYEVSNHAQTNAESRHNTVYWNCGDYVGIGPGAHGRITQPDGTRLATYCPSGPIDWLQAATVGNWGEAPRETLTPTEQASELLVMGLRVNSGVDLSRVNQLDMTFINNKKMNDMVKSGHLIRDGNNLRTSETGRILLNSIIRALTDS